MRGTVRRNAVAPTPFRTALRNGDMPRIITNDMITMNPEIRNAGARPPLLVCALFSQSFGQSIQFN